MNSPSQDHATPAGAAARDHSFAPREDLGGDLWELLKSKEYRDSLMARLLADHLSTQIRENRIARGWSQDQLAERAGLSFATVNRLEQRDKVLHTSISTLLALACAFDCALIVRFVSWSEWLGFEFGWTPGGVIARSFDAEELAAMARPAPAPDDASGLNPKETAP